MACATSSSGWRVCLFHHVGRKSVEPAVGFEPTTCRLQGGCSWPAELSGREGGGGQPGSRTPYVTWTAGLQQAAVASAARYPMCVGADEGTRTPGLDVGDVAFCLTELHPRIDYDVRSLNSA